MIEVALRINLVSRKWPYDILLKTAIELYQNLIYFYL